MWFLLFLLILSGSSPIVAQESTISASPSANIVTPEITATASATATPIPPTPTPRLFDQYKNDYLFQYDQYQQDYLVYVDKKRVYTKYGTITTQKEKFSAAISAINSRNKAFKSYLLALRVLLDDYKSANPTQTEKNQIDLGKWEAWFTEQITVVPAINNDDDLKKWTEDFKEKYIVIQGVIYTSLVQHEINLRQLTLDKLQEIATDIRNNPSIRPESQQWISSLTVKSDLISTSFNSALTFTRKNQSQTKFSNFYPDSKLELNKSNNYLREISADLKLIVTKFYSQ
ncbi:MAG: hypothetical protein WC851_04965 [Candidatus Shapirobacteria bacterium]|jgi:hypothetical protein